MKSTNQAVSAAVHKTTLLIVTDLGHLKAYRVDPAFAASQPRLRIIEDVQTEVADHLSEKWTVEPVQLRKAPSTAGASSDGQEHNLSLERRHRAVKALGKRIEDLVGREKPAEFYFAADPQINEPLLAELDPKTRDKISRNICANLSKIADDELLQKFGLKM